MSSDLPRLVARFACSSGWMGNYVGEYEGGEKRGVREANYVFARPTQRWEGRGRALMIIDASTEEFSASESGVHCEKM